MRRFSKRFCDRTIKGEISLGERAFQANIRVKNKREGARSLKVPIHSYCHKTGQPRQPLPIRFRDKLTQTKGYVL